MMREEAAKPGQDRSAGTATREAAFAAWEAVLYAMAATPADGLTGVAVKARQILRTLDTGESNADAELAESLQADLERLVPAVVAT